MRDERKGTATVTASQPGQEQLSSRLKYFPLG
jgi:hypothetical protein